MYMYIYVYVYIWEISNDIVWEDDDSNIKTYMPPSMYVYNYVCILCICILRIYILMRVYICMYAYADICVYLSIFTYMYVCIYMGN
jgi:hypothetical protein